LATALVMIVGLLALVLYQGLQTFWPTPLTEIKLVDESGTAQTLLGEISRYDTYHPEPSFLDELKKSSPELAAKAESELQAKDEKLLRDFTETARRGCSQLAGAPRVWINGFAVQSTSEPDWAVVAERFDGGRSYGTPKSLLADGQSTASTPEDTWQKLQ